MICLGCCFAASATTFLLAKGVSKHAVRFSRSDSFRRSPMNLGFFSSKCTCVSTMRLAVLSETGISSPARNLLVGGAFTKPHVLGTTAAAPAVPRNFRRDSRFLIGFPPFLQSARNVILVQIAL